MSAILFTLGMSGCGTTEVVDRFEDGTPILIRSPQPDEGELEGLHELYGVRTVLNLRGQHPGRSWFDEERRGVEKIGARWIHLAISGREAPSVEQIRRFFAVVERAENWPILMHCQGGVHRAGFMTAIYRVQYQGWSVERAIKDMDDHYFEWGVTDRSALKRYLRSYRPNPGRRLPSSD